MGNDTPPDVVVRKSGSRKPLLIGLGLLAMGVIVAVVLLPLYFLEVAPFDKDDTASPLLPPPASPPPPPAPPKLASASASTVKMELTAAGDVADYTDAKKTSIAESIAAKLGVNVADVTVTVEAASVKIIVVVKTDSPASTKAALEAEVATTTSAQALLGGDVVVETVTNDAVSDVPSPPPPFPPSPSPSPPPPPTGTPVVAGLKTVAALTTVEPTGSRRRQLDLGRFARRLATRPTGGEYADTSDQAEYLEDIVTEYFSTPNMIICMVAAARADAMVNTGNQPYLAAVDDKKCQAKGEATTSSSGGGGGGGTTQNTAKAISYMAINSQRANTGCDASGNGCTAPMIVQGHVLLAPETDSHADDYNPNEERRVFFYMEVTEGAEPGGTYFNGQFKMDYTVLYCPGQSPTECDDDANYMKQARGTLSVGQGGAPSSISFADTSVMGPGMPTMSVKTYVTGEKSAGSGAGSLPDWSQCQSENCVPGEKTLQFGYAGTTYCLKDASSPETCFDRDRSKAAESVWTYGLYDDVTGARFDLPQGGFGIKTASGTRGWAGYHGIHLDGTAPSAMNGQVVTKNDGSGSYTIEIMGGRLKKRESATKTLDDIDKVEFIFWSWSEVTVGGQVYNSGGNGHTTFVAHWDRSSDTFKIVGRLNEQWQKTLFSSPETVTAAQLNNFTAFYYMGQLMHESGIRGWSEGLGQSELAISPAVLKSADPGAQANGVKYNIESVVMPGDTSVPSAFVCLTECTTYAKLSALSEQSMKTDAFTDATKDGNDILLEQAESYTFDPSQMTITHTSESNPVSSSSIPGSVRNNHELQHGIEMTLIPDTAKSGLVCEWDQQKYCGWKARTELDVYYVYEVGPQDWHSQSYLKEGGSYVQFTPPLHPTFVVPNDPAQFKDYAGSTLVLHYTGHGELHVPTKCYSKKTNEEQDCNHESRHVPALSIPYDSDGFVTMKDGSTKWVKWLDKEIRFKHDTSVTAAGSGITFGDTSSLPQSPDLSASADDPSNSASAKYSGSWPAPTFASTPAVYHGQVCSDTPKPAGCA